MSAMKKIAASLVLLVYAASCLGFGIRQFYCCGELRSVSIEFFKPVKEGGSTEYQGCCQTRHFNFKVKDTHLSADGHAGIPAIHWVALPPVSAAVCIARPFPLI